MKNHYAENANKHHLSRGADRIDSSAYRSRMKLGVIAVFGLLSIVGNIATSFLASALHVPIFLDTIFTVAITFYAGLVPGLIVAVLHNPIRTFIRSVIYGTDLFYFGSLYAVCGMLIALSTWIFSRNKKDFFFNRTVTVLYLLIIVFVSSFLSCFSASALDTFIRLLFEKSSGSVEHSGKDGSALPQHDKICIMIFDDGTGFDTTALDAESELHFGMRGMEMSAKLLGGTLTITSKPETGTEVRVEVPANG